MLNQAADGVWVRQSEWVWTNSIAMRGEDGLILIDPGIDGFELKQLADDVDRLGIPVVALVTPLPADGGPVPGEIIEHQAHAIGHAAVLLADRGVLLAGDMLSDVLIPLLDAGRPDQVGAYETALDQLGEAARHVDVLVPGHGAVAKGREVAARLAADNSYIDALRRGEEPVDARLGPDADWLSGPHRSNLEQAQLDSSERVTTHRG
jgi:glyoxylase-like metal-dependent hydrolase (beta-lactamase superfamily II)